jgi:hypothetical protein
MQHEDSCRTLRSHRDELDGRVYCCLCTLGLFVTFPPVGFVVSNCGCRSVRHPLRRWFRADRLLMDLRPDLRCARQVVRLSNANPVINSGIASCGLQCSYRRLCVAG